MADGAFKGWTVACCFYHNLVKDSKIPPTSSADMRHNFASKPVNSLSDILTTVSEDLIKKAADFFFHTLLTNSLHLHPQKKRLII